MPLPISYLARLQHGRRASSWSRTPPGSAASTRTRRQLLRQYRRRARDVPADLPGVQAAAGSDEGLARRSAGRHRRAAISRTRFGWKIGDRIPIQGTFYQPKSGDGSTWEFNIVGIYDGDRGRRQDAVLLPLRLSRREPDASAQGTVGWYLVKIADPSRAAEMSREVRRDVRELVGRNQDDHRERLRRRASPIRSATSARS